MTTTTLPASDSPAGARPRVPKAANVLLWIAQVGLAFMFLSAGWMKLATPAAVMQAQSPLPIELLRFVAVAEILGALGLILPGLFRIRQILTPLAAAGLAIIMAGAVVLTARGPDLSLVALPFAVGVVAVAIAYGRWRELRR